MQEMMIMSKTALTMFPISPPKKIKIFSFFSGVGFLDLGFERVGFNIAFVNEFNPLFLNAYKYARRNSNTIPEYGYSTKSVEDFLDDHIWEQTFGKSHSQEMIGFIGGPPCPDFSVAGKNLGCDGKNGSLTNVYTKLIIRRKPDFFVFENVKGLVQTKKHMQFFVKIKKQLYKAGYSLWESIENALEYGVPQDRDRLILIGFRRNTFGKKIKFNVNYPKKFHKEEIIKKAWPYRNPFLERQNLPMPNDIIEELTVEYWFRHNHVESHPNGNDVFQVKNITKYMKIEEGNVSGKSFKRLHRWRYSPTAAYGNNEVHLHPYELRRLSVAEALAIQSLPPDFDLPKQLPLSTKFKMVGNGVPFLLAKAIALHLNRFLTKRIGD